MHAGKRIVHFRLASLKLKFISLGLKSPEVVLEIAAVYLYR